MFKCKLMTVHFFCNFNYGQKQSAKIVGLR